MIGSAAETPSARKPTRCPRCKSADALVQRSDAQINTTRGMAVVRFACAACGLSVYDVRRANAEEMAQAVAMERKARLDAQRRADEKAQLMRTLTAGVCHAVKATRAIADMF